MKTVPHEVVGGIAIPATLSDGLYRMIVRWPGGPGPVFDSPHDVAVHIRKASGDHYKGVATDSLAGYIQQCAPIDGRTPQKPVSKRLAQSIRIAIVEKLGTLYSPDVLDRLGNWLPAPLDESANISKEVVEVVLLNDLLDRWADLESLSVQCDRVSALFDSGFMGAIADKLIWKNGPQPAIEFILPSRALGERFWRQLSETLITRVEERYAIPLPNAEDLVCAFLLDHEEHRTIRVQRYDAFVTAAEPYALATLRSGYRCVAGLLRNVQWYAVEGSLPHSDHLFPVDLSLKRT